MKNKITVEEWVNELEKVSEEATADGVSTAEIAEIIGLSIHTTRDRIGKWIDAGYLVYAGDRLQINRANRRCRIPVYRYVGNKKGGKGK